MFEKELALIENPVIKRIAEDAVKLIPDYFYTIPASSTGKYHPKFALGDGGLYRHVQAAVIIANELFRNIQFSFTPDERDLIITALIFHDSFKQGKNEALGHTTFLHPRIAAEKLTENIIVNSIDERNFLESICGMIESHMGQWNRDGHSNNVLPLPQGDMQKFVHLVDYLASRRVLEVVL